LDAPLNEAATVIPFLAVADGGDNKFGVPPAGRDNAIERYARATFPACLRYFHETSAAAIDDIDAIAATLALMACSSVPMTCQCLSASAPISIIPR